MADRSVVVRYAADITRYVAGMSRMRSATADFARTASAHAQKQSRDWEQMSSRVGAAGIALGIGVAAAVKRFADFDEEMSAVQAATGATGGQLDRLRLTAIKLGADSKYSAREAAQGITEMAKAGVSARDIIGGGLAGALDLAAAGGLDVGRAAEIAAVSLKQFNLQGQDLAHVADLYAAAAGKAVGSVDDIAQAMKYAGVTANSMGISIEETTGVLGLFASQGIIGEQAGTSFRGMLLSLTSPSKIARKAMDDLGISLYDGTGRFVGMEGAAQVLQDKLGPLDEATRNAALGQIFGNEQMGAAIALYQAGGKGVEEWTRKVNDAGFAQKQAAALTNNLKGDVEKLGGALDSVFIQGGSGTNGALRELVQGLTDAVGWFGDLPVSVQQSTVKLALFTAGALLAAAAVMKVGAAAAATKANLVAMGLSAERAGKLMRFATVGGAVVAVAALVSELQGYIRASTVATVRTDELAESLDQLGTTRLSGGLADLFRDESGPRARGLHTAAVSAWRAEKIVSTADAVKRFGDAANDAFSDGMVANAVRFLGLGYSDTKFKEYITQLDAALAKMVQDGNADQAAASLEQLLAGVDADKVEQVRASLTQYGDALVGVKDGALAADPALQGLTSAQKAAALSAQEATDATGDWAKTLSDINSPMLDARSAARDFEAAVDDATAALKENGKTLDISTAKGRANQAALDDVASSAISQISALQANGASQAELQATLARSRDRLIDTARQFGMSKSAAEAYADSVLAVPSSTSTTAHFNGGAAESAVERFRVKLDGLNGKTISTYINVINRQYGQVGASTQGGLTREDGGIVAGTVHAFESGGIYLDSGRSVARQPLLASGGGPILFNEPVTHFEAFISGKPAARARNQSVLSQVAPKLGMRVVKAEDGALSGRSAPAAMGGFSAALLSGIEAAAERGIVRGAERIRLNLDGEPIARSTRAWMSGRRR